ncbi:vitamin K epoxide reductase family protein [Aciditerrimonas ferrireducens]|uniref:vitamin K epoxide reductase family protein n=1 Tax=Aciditerrimonas ferrireducens TaxID=667306 RepID=UPI0020043C1D|nr:vitamin K epoxide reductase family protein [Aciditerrimonas ferrireducens]MCK4176969.1 vitamin K epoxide reductase family protein [Aciditerrimonas ferrireducens]
MATSSDGEEGDAAAWLEDLPRVGRAVPWVALVLCVLGVADGAYLTYTHFHPGALVCSTSGLINCARVTTSQYSRVLGIPVAILGLAFYVVLTAVNLPPLWRSTSIWLARLRLAMVVVGMGMVIYLVIAELFLIGNICEYCTGVHILTFGMFVLVVLTYPTLAERARQAGSAVGEATAA